MPFGGIVSPRTYSNVVRHPQDYGVTFNGTTDDTSAWATMLAAAPPGATIELPSGTSLVSSITIPKGLRVVGQGRATTAIAAKTGASGPLISHDLSGVQTGFCCMSGFTIDMTNAPAIVALDVADMGAGSILEELYVYKGSEGLDIGHCGNLTCRDLVLVGQTSKAISVNGDDSAELMWDSIVIDTGGATLTTGFDIYRTTAPDIGGHYLHNVKITAGGGSITTPFYFHSSTVNTFFGIEMVKCVGDGAGITNALHAVNAQTMQLSNNWLAAVNSASNNSVKLEGCIYVRLAANNLGGPVSFDSDCLGVAVDASNIVQWGDYTYRMPASGTPTDLNLEAMTYATALTNDLTKLLTATGSGYKMGKNSVFAHRILLRDTAGGTGLPFLQNTSDQFQFWGADGNFKMSVANSGIFTGQPLLGYPDVTVSVGDPSFRYVNGYFSGFHELDEMADAAAPGSNKARLYVRDSGGGKTQLVVRFPTGAVQVIATEP